MFAFEAGMESSQGLDLWLVAQMGNFKFLKSSFVKLGLLIGLKKIHAAFFFFGAQCNYMLMKKGAFCLLPYNLFSPTCSRAEGFFFLCLCTYAQSSVAYRRFKQM